jgi:hypothetical protein
MLAELIDKLKVSFLPPTITKKVNEREYKVVQTPNGPQLGDLIVPPIAPALLVKSLSGFRDAYIAGLDGFDPKTTAVQVINHEDVALVSIDADENGLRHHYLRAQNAEENPFPFDSYQVPEAFLLSLQCGFLPTENIVQLQLFASSLSNESSMSTQDDGFTQTVTAKQGSVSRVEVPLPKRIKLMPYRTFREIDPVESEFIVRLKGTPGQLPQVALISVDGGRWKHDTMLMLRNWLVRELPTGTVVIA